MMMKKILKHYKKDGERGIILLSALVFLVLGSIMIVPLLGYMNTGLNAGQTYENKMDELYGADAGIEDAIWQIRMIGERNPGVGEESTYPLGTDINGNAIEVYIWRINNDIAMITSTASDGTEITAFVTSNIAWGDIMDNAITSPGDIEISPNVTINGDVQYNGSITDGDEPVEDRGYTLNGEEDTSTINSWPTSSYLIEFYLNQVESLAPYSSNAFDLGGSDQTLGPIYRDGSFEIVNSSNTASTLTLTGPLYITNDTLIGATGKDFTIDLNGQTIFVESDNPSYALKIGGKCTLTGSGCIVAIGSVYFQPNIAAGEDGFILTMSQEGTIQMQPNGDYSGSIAGDCQADLQPGTTITNPGISEEQKDALNFPTGAFGGDVGALWGVMSWEIS